MTARQRCRARSLLLLLLLLAQRASGLRGQKRGLQHCGQLQHRTPSSSTSRLKALGSLSVGGLPVLASALSVAGVVALHEAGHFLAARVQGMKIESYNIGYGPRLLGFNDSSGTEFALRAVPLGGYVAFPSNVEVDDDGKVIKELDDPDLLQNRPPLQRALVISAGVIANILLTWALATGTASTTGIGRPVYSDGISVTMVSDVQSPGYRAGLRADDVISKVNGQTIRGADDAVQGFISVIRANADRPVELEVRRGGGGSKGAAAGAVQSSKAAIFPQLGGGESTLQLKVVPRPSGPGGKGTIGVSVNSVVSRVDTIKARGPLDAARIGAQETWRLVSFTWAAFSKAVSSGSVGSEVGGPISVVKAGAQMAQDSPQALVGFAATLSVNLAILNALPFPALDGGQLMFVLFELVAGRPVPRDVKNALTGLAFSFLLLLGASTLVGDLSRVSEPVGVLRSVRPTADQGQSQGQDK